VTYVFASTDRLDLTFDQVKALLGGKAANLSVMALDLCLPVPPAFTISTAACTAYLADGWPAGLDGEIRDHMSELEQRVGRRFGDPADPLLVSVRSGAPESMPGMMDTILNLGLNEQTTRGLAAVSTSAAFATDCRTRFESMFLDIVGVDVVPDDPWAQLRAAIEAVFRSWNSDRARAYRAREAISDDLGTAVTIQAMVFGNRNPESGSGVLFTRNPATGEPDLYGDVLFDAQGEDVVAGTHPTAALAELAVRMPSLADELDRYARTLERHHADLCDIEFTIEDGTLWLLQSRIGKRSPQAALRIAIDMAEDEGFPLTRAQAVERVASLLVDPPRASSRRSARVEPLAIGLPASPGLATGEIATTPDAAIALAESGRPVILVRAETSPDDVHGMARSTGLLTSRGGLASHAAVVARGWGIPAVVGASSVLVSDDAVSINGRRIALGSAITIDGTTGEIFEGAVAGSVEVVPEAAILRGWAQDLGIPIGDGPATADGDGDGVTPPPLSAAAGGLGPVSVDTVLGSLALKGYAAHDGLAEALFSDTDEIGSILDGLVEDGLCERVADSYRLSAAGKDAAGRLLTEDQVRFGMDRAATALDSFVALDRRMKDTVTAWQMREVDGSQVINDHADPDYDAGVLARLQALHDDALAWLAPMVGTVARYAFYPARLGRAARLAAAGDGRYIASPRVDSYHSIWFELHEDLILISGRTRAEEAAAGRA